MTTPNPIDQSKPVTIDEIIKRAKTLHTYPGYRKPKNLQYVTTIDEDIFAINKIVMDIIKSSEPKGYEITEPHAVYYEHGYNEAIEIYKDNLIEAAHQYGLGETK
jgi:hypothetical protein